ncbi:MAG: DUF5615 family PIN-like protein [Planctomycetes bacterium]|nr:DUF5615 family PIN-like protein [Planctomycetota bacterium]
MKLYLDDDMADRLLLRLLTSDGHDVIAPADAGLAGSSDPIHLLYAAGCDRPILTGNHEDFFDLHNLVIQTGGHHSGILVVRKDNDRRRDLTPRGIAPALRNLESAGIPLADAFHIVNHWR